MKITWYGTASVILETENTSLVFDPYLKDVPRKKESKEIKENRRQVFSTQKNVLITHGHFDHLASVKSIYQDKDCKVYLTKTPFMTLKKRKFPSDKLQEIHAGDTLFFGDISVRVLAGKHVQFISYDVIKSFFKRIIYLPRAIRLGIDFFKYPENNETLVYEVFVEDKVIQIMGSAGLRDDVDYTCGADVLILPHQGRHDIDNYNRLIVERLKPKRVLLDHYDDSFPPFSRDINVDNFCDTMSKTVQTEKLKEGQLVEV